MSRTYQPLGLRMYFLIPIFRTICSDKKENKFRGSDNSLISMGLVRRPNRMGTGGDRYIPCRKAMNMEQASYYLTQATRISDPSKLPKPPERILKFSQERPKIPDRDASAEPPKPKKPARHIPDVCFLFFSFLKSMLSYLHG